MPATILIVDDSRVVRGMVRGVLETDHHQVLEAAHGLEALDVAANTEPDLVITDINMPEMDGLSLIRELRQRPRFQWTPILVLSTETGPAIKQRGREAGATGWIVKPFHPEQLRQAALSALQLREKALRKLGGAPS